MAALQCTLKAEWTGATARHSGWLRHDFARSTCAQQPHSPHKTSPAGRAYLLPTSSHSADQLITLTAPLTIGSRHRPLCKASLCAQNYSLSSVLTSWDNNVDTKIHYVSTSPQWQHTARVCWIIRIMPVDTIARTEARSIAVYTHNVALEEILIFVELKNLPKALGPLQRGDKRSAGLFNEESKATGGNFLRIPTPNDC